MNDKSLRKTRHAQHGESKTEQVFLRLTPTAKRNIQNQADQEGVSFAEMIERFGRGQASPPGLQGESSAS